MKVLVSVSKDKAEFVVVKSRICSSERDVDLSVISVQMIFEGIC